MTKKLLCTSFFALGILFSRAQELPYTITVLNQQYQALDEGISLNNGNTWDDPEYNIPLGFTFQFMDEVITSMMLTGTGSFLISDLQQPMLNLMAPYGDDLIDAGYVNGVSESPIRYQLTGNSGSRILKIEWHNVAFYYELELYGTANNRLSFQVWLYEGSNIIEFRYGPNSIKSGEELHDLGAPVAFIAKNLNFFTGDWEALWILGGEPTNPSVNIYMNPDEAPGPELIYNAELPDGLVQRFTPTFVSVLEQTKNNPLVIYPTQTRDQVNALWTGNTTQASVLDLNGRVVKTFTVMNGRNRLDVSDLSAGMYLVSINDQSTIYSAKIIKE